MKNLFLTSIILLSSLFSQAQSCGNFIDLVGIGIHGQQEAVLTISNGSNAEYIEVEAIYKSKTPPTNVEFSSSLETIEVEPVDVLHSGSYNNSYYSVVYKTKMLATSQIKLDILNNSTDFYSFAAYVFQPGSALFTNLSGELYHVFQNADNPLSLDIAVPVTDQPKDVKIRFGISELNDDSRYAIFKFYAGASMQEIVVRSWDDLNGETDSYTIKEASFDALPGNVDKIVFTLISDEFIDGNEGDSYVAGITLLDLPCEEESKGALCSYTQGFYGNAGGKTCSKESTTDLLTRLLASPLTVGGNGNQLSISSPQCVFDLLPGGGKSKALNGSYNCSNINLILNKKGQLKNTLLAQTITLGLNLRNSPGLTNIVLSESFFVQDAESCEDPQSTGIAGTEMEFGFSSSIINYLGSGATIADLNTLANEAVAGEDIYPLTLSEVSDAATIVNEAFDECKVIVSVTDHNLKSSTESFQKVANNSMNIDVQVYPIPVKDRFVINLPSEIEHVKTIFIINLNGQVVSALNNLENQNSIEVNNHNLQPGVYFISVYTGTQTLNKRFTVL